MVDDPSGYADVLLSDPKRRRAATRALKRRRAEHVTTAAGSVESVGGESTVSAESAGPVADTAPGEQSDRQALRDMAAELERDRLFGIIEELVLWENTTNESVLERTRTEIRQSWRRACAENAEHPRAREFFDRHRLPASHDPLAGGGALPLEAQRLGLEAHASDDGVPLRDGGTGATAYADAVGVYLGITVSRLANRHAFLSFWDPMRQTVQLGLCPSGSADGVGSLRRQSVQRFQRQLAWPVGVSRQVRSGGFRGDFG